MALPNIHKDSLDQHIIAHCWGSNAEFIGGTEQLGSKVVKIDDNTVVKFGTGVKRFEFENLKIAKSLVDPSVVYIPDAYRFFCDDEGKRNFVGDNGYILMEYVHGTKIDPIEDPALVQRIADIIGHFASLRGEKPGTLSRGPCNGILFADRDEFTFDTVQALEDFINRRVLNKPKVNMKGVDLVLCHLDIAPRNILWREDGSICFLDWASAGFYPRCFEFTAQHYLLGFEKNFNQMLMDTIRPPLAKEEEAQSFGVMTARGNSERYTFRTDIPPPRWANLPKKSHSSRLPQGVPLNPPSDAFTILPPPGPNTGHIYSSFPPPPPPQSPAPYVPATGVGVDGKIGVYPPSTPLWACNNIGFHIDEILSDPRIP
ncbi:hypothetical protein FQN54_007974 [Arachnomyces sp. PD_36]|nr:hypothetical protein FQN54_007974 [Arachnomyces sp. PD_36]